ncbi:MAG: hypothetical protein D6733_00725 [Methanobacteriota archaeon]|nr:MAG: hypothetical protein D6733_00725 [Euryarchaeota archaeon]
MTGAPEQVEITGRLIATPTKTEAVFEQEEVHVDAKASSPVIIVFSATYRWAEEGDTRLNDWDFYMTIEDEKGEVIHSDYKHFGEDEPEFLGDDEKRYMEYLQDEDNFQSGDGAMVRSIRTPATPGTYTYLCEIRAQFWARGFREEKGLEKNKTESVARCKVTVTVSE